jgi:hypothetical protein
MQRRFGRMLLHSATEVSISLDLYETDERDLLGVGLILDPEAGDPSIVHDVELTVAREVWDRIDRETGLAHESLPLERRLADGERADLVLEAHQPDPGREAVCGRVRTEAEAMRFVIEEFGSPNPVVLIPVIVWGLLCAASTIHDLVRSCERRARETCGEGNVRSVQSKRSWHAAGCSTDCVITCR